MENEKKSFNFKKLKKDVQGITLIALVVTVIVLLSLAGIALNLTIGQNGIFSRAEIAANTWRNAETNEQLAMNMIANWINGVTTTTSTFDANTLTIGDAINFDKYGWKVSNYNVQTDDMKTNVWRLFYQDDNYTYLITDECLGIYKPSDYYTGAYNNGADVSKIGQKLNPMLLKNENFFISSNMSENLLATAWLTDTNKWAKFANSDAVFAIGSPTIELFVKSFNATASKNKANQIILGVGTSGYTESENQLETSYNMGIYNEETSSFWLSSPENDFDFDITKNCRLMYVSMYGYFSSYYANRDKYAVRPIVCIPTTVFNDKYTLVDE